VAHHGHPGDTDSLEAMGVDVHEDLAALSFLLGRWEGVGVADYPDGQEYRFGQEVVFDHDGGPHLNYRSTVWTLDDDGKPQDFVAAESGYWRPRPAEVGEQQGGDGKPAPQVEVFITHAEGFTELYYGTILATRIELVTDAVMRSDTAREATAGHRLYGLIGDDRRTLGYAWDLTADGRTFQMSAQLQPARLQPADL
jgi:hypothetical protein